MDTLEKKVNNILQKAKIKEFDGRTIAFLEKEDFLDLLRLKKQKENEFIKEGLNEKDAKRLAFRDKFKIINPAPPHPIKVMNFTYAPGYSLLKDKEKILRDIDKDFSIWVNSMRKNAKKLAKEAKNDAEKQKILDKFEAEIEKAKHYYEFIKSNPDVKVIRTDYFFVSELYKPFITYYNPLAEKRSQKYKKEYLRKDVFNVVYEEMIVIPKKSKGKIEKELREMNNVFGYYYIKL